MPPLPGLACCRAMVCRITPGRLNTKRRIFMTTVLKPDICVIGTGIAAATLAMAMAARGLRTVVVDDGLGARDHDGANAALALIATARRLRARPAPFAGGETAGEPVDFRAVMTHVRSIVATMSVNVSAARLAACGIPVIEGAARFIDRRSAVVGEVTIRPGRFVVAVASAPAVPAIPGIEGVDCLTPESLPDLTRKPAHLVVLGADAAGLELAQAFSSLGSRVTVLSQGEPLPGCDPELAAFALRALCRQDVDIRQGVEATRVEPRGRTGLRLTLFAHGQETVLDASALLVTGRAPVLGHLDLAKAGIAADQQGITVSPQRRSSNRRVHAIDGSDEHQADLVSSILSGKARTGRSSIAPGLVRTDPEIAWVGLTEDEARRRHPDMRILRLPLAEAERALLDCTAPGLLKLCVDRTGRVLGAALAAPDAGEQIGIWALAVARKSSLDEMLDFAPPRAAFSGLVGPAVRAFNAVPPAPSLWRRLTGRR